MMDGGRRPLRASWAFRPPLSAFFFSFALGVIALFTACNGGGQPSGSPTPTVTPVEGLSGTRIDLAETSPLLTIFGADSADFSEGFPTLATGDFNGDGRHDYLIGAAQGDGSDNSREDAGEAYVILGEDDQPESLDLAEGVADVIVYGESPGDNLGWTVLAADINADGLDDVILGAPGTTGELDPRTDQGRVYVFFGSDDLEGIFDLADAPSDLTFTGAEGFSRIGSAMTSGDVNGDGVPDLILGAPFAGRARGTPPGSSRTQVGEVYVVFGSPALSGQVSAHLDEQDFTVGGTQRNRQFGASVDAGDVNGDGIDDIVVGAPRVDVETDEGKRTSAGAVYVFFGSSTLGGRTSIEEDAQDVEILGVDEEGFFGFPALVGDVSGDATDDLVIGARQSPPLGSDRFAAGETYVVYGDSTLEGVLDIADGGYDALILGAQASQLLPVSMLLADATGDGTSDIILGSTVGIADRDRAGILYLLEGGSSLSGQLDMAGELAAVSILGAEEDDRLGAAVALAEVGGEPALLALAPGAEGPEEQRPDSGRIYLIGLLP